MTTMTGKDYRDILNTLYTVNCCEDTESFLDTLMPSMIQLFHAECITFHLLKGYPWHIKIVESRAFKTDEHDVIEDKVFPALYTAGLYQKSPLLKDALSSSKLILKTGESISFKEWEKSDLYNNFILPQNLYRELFVTLRWKNSLEGMFTLWRSKKQPDYQQLDVSKAEMLAPHLMVAMRHISAESKIKNWQRHFIPEDDTNREGLILLDHKLKPVYFNTKARQICLQLNGSAISGKPNSQSSEFSIPGAIVTDCSTLSHMLKIDEPPILWPKERILVTENSMKFHSECSLIWRSDQINPQPNFIVILNDLSDGNDPGINLQARFHLSKRELDIIYYIVKGLSYCEIAEKLFISKLTVHTHVKNIYRKLGAKNRIELYSYIQSPNWPS